MAEIVGPSGRPIEKEEKEEEAQEDKGNGEHESGIEDVRTLPTGTLIYNLIRFSLEEVKFQGRIELLEHMKQEQKVVGDPPELLMCHMQLKQWQTARFICAKEINDRFRKIDEERVEELGLILFKDKEPNGEG